MTLLSLLLLAGPLNVLSRDSASAQTPPLDICISGLDEEGLVTFQPAYHRVVQNCQLREAGLDEVEEQAIQELLAMHQLPAADANRLVAWERNAIRALIFTELMEIIAKEPAERTQTEQAIVDVMTQLVQQRRIVAAQYANDEYDEWVANPCAYEEPYDTEWSQDLQWCTIPLVQTTRGPISPTINNFLTYGQAHVYKDFANGGAAFNASSDTVKMIGLAAGLVATLIATGVGATIGASLTVTSPLILAIHPFLANAVAWAATGSSTAVGAVSGAAAGGVGAGSIGAIVGVIVFAIVIVVFAAIQLAGQLALPGQLDQALVDAQSDIDLRTLAQSDSGKAEIYATYILQTTPRGAADFAPNTDLAPVPDAQSTDRTFVITDADGNKTHSQTLNYLCWNAVTDCKSGLEHQARLSGGWFVDQDFSSGGPGTRMLTLGIDYVNQQGDGWTAWRVGPQQFLHTRTGDGSEPFLSNEIKYKGWDEQLYTASINQPPTSSTAPVVTSTINQGEFEVNWSASTDVDGDTITYTLDRCNPSIIVVGPDGSSSLQCNPIASGLTVLSHTFTSAALEPEGQWSYRVRAWDGYEEGGSSLYSGPVLVDRTAPSITFLSRAPEANENGWNKEDVTVKWSCSDSIPGQIFPTAGVVAAEVSNTVTTEGEGQSTEGTCADKAGNSASSTQLGISIDKTAPVVETGGPYVVDEGSSVLIDGSNSSDARSGLWQIVWNYDETQSADSLAFSYFAVNGPDTKTFDLTLTDKAGNQKTVQTSLTINNLAPTMTKLVAGTSLIATNQPFSVDVEATDVPADTLDFFIECANGITNQVPGVSSTPGVFTATTSCSYATPGDYTIRSYAKDSDGASSAMLLATSTVQIVTPKSLCVDQRTGAIHAAERCGRGETQVVLPEDGALTMCVNQWNGSVRMGSNCTRSERVVTVIGDESVSVCVNQWNGVMRVSESCSRSERHEWL